MTDDQIASVMKPVMKPFVVYKHLNAEISFGWRSNSPDARTSEDIQIIEYVDTLQEAVAAVKRYSQE